MEHRESMSGERQVSEALPQPLHSYDVRNRPNVVLSSLGIRTWADIFEASQREYEQASMRGDTTRRRRRGALGGERQRGSHGQRGGFTGLSNSGMRQEGEAFSEHFERLDACNRQNLARAGLEIRTSADIFQSEQERAIAERSSGRRRRVRRSGGGPVSQVVASVEVDTAEQAHITEPSGRPQQGMRPALGSIDQQQATSSRTEIMDAGEQDHVAESSRRQQQQGTRPALGSIDQQQSERSRTEVNGVEQVHVAESSSNLQQGRRQAPGSIDRQRPKRRRTVIRRERSDEEQLEDIATVVRALDEEFAEKERLSTGGAWWPIPQVRMVSTVQEFYKAFHDLKTLPIRTCMLCYGKFAEGSTSLSGKAGLRSWLVVEDSA